MGSKSAERAFTNQNHTNTFRAQEVGPLGRRFFINTRLNVGWSDTDRRSVLEAPTTRILDARTSGGAQKDGGRHSRDVNFAADLDYVRGIHSVRLGTAIDANWYRSDETENYLGTYTFENIAAFDAGRPRSYTRRIGDPNVNYFNLQGAVYIQDDIRVRRSLSVTPGVRVETQTHIKGVVVGPRLGATWAPFKDGKTTLRASWGLFYDWLQTNTYEQTIRIDGFRQQEINIANPSYPEPPLTIAGVTPADRYLLDPALGHPRNSRVSGGVDYAFSQRYRVNATYRYIRGEGMFRGLNLNAPVNGLRPSPEFGNVIQVVGDGRMRQHAWNFGGQTNFPQELGRTAKRWDFRRFNFFGNYTLAWSDNNTDGPFSVPATGSLDSEWGNANSHAKHRFFGGFLTQAFRDVSLQLNVNGHLGTAYGMQTGFDDNGDLIFNDRPAGSGEEYPPDRSNLDAEHVLGVFVHVRPVDSAAPGHPVRTRSGRHAHGDDGDAARSGTLPDGAERGHLQPDEPHELHGLQRSADVALLSAANLVTDGASHSHRHEFAVLRQP